MERITDYLTADHARLHALLDAAMRGPDLDDDAFADFRAGLLRHIAIEEKLVLPAARRANGVPVALARDLRVDHAALTSLLVPTPTLCICHEIALLLRSHDAIEEGGVYAECERLIGDAESTALTARARSFSAPPLAAHFDGPGVHRTASSALESARRMTAPRGRPAAP